MQNKDKPLPKLIILSDLWGKVKPDWMVFYTEILTANFDIIYYDSCDLGGVDIKNLTESGIHDQFISGGIDRAVKNLLNKNKHPKFILGFSVGGYIAWQASKLGLKSEQLFTVSSTRLRYETLKPTIKTILFFGAQDPYRPDEDWLKNMDLTHYIYRREEHEFYKKKHFAEKICGLIVAQI